MKHSLSLTRRNRNEIHKLYSKEILDGQDLLVAVGLFNIVVDRPFCFLLGIEDRLMECKMQSEQVSLIRLHQISLRLA